MTQNFVAEMVIKASDVEDAADGVAEVVGGAIVVVSGMGTVVGATGAGGTISVGGSSCCACSSCDAAGAGVAICGAYPSNWVHLSRVNRSRQCWRHLR